MIDRKTTLKRCTALSGLLYMAFYSAGLRTTLLYYIPLGLVVKDQDKIMLDKTYLTSPEGTKYEKEVHSASVQTQTKKNPERVK